MELWVDVKMKENCVMIKKQAVERFDVLVKQMAKAQGIDKHDEWDM